MKKNTISVPSTNISEYYFKRCSLYYFQRFKNYFEHHGNTLPEIVCYCG